MNAQLAIGADETGAVVLWEIDETGQATPISVQNQKWHEWVELAARHGRSPGALIPVSLDDTATIVIG